ncbi:hypothetical protein M427DRAFT_51119 [Gonapodya prolifera JEL478]|uniref:BZIP domain-containing protein n=1 Tax=Gonapodya prolifera (strain JEL478) TaxID=1344416 RepID=A0A139AYB8_GONPJ|nr:hypothetical protein M427DRAFT_51119 [Gonapodya prolifera JEL478]|eukprot:KXS21738.1 hypothetical protein M427DRAFT_51119 [Gonapodya prolifera JEL478]
MSAIRSSFSDSYSRSAPYKGRTPEQRERNKQAQKLWRLRKHKELTDLQEELAERRVAESKLERENRELKSQLQGLRDQVKLLQTIVTSGGQTQISTIDPESVHATPRLPVNAFTSPLRHSSSQDHTTDHSTLKANGVVKISSPDAVPLNFIDPLLSSLTGPVSPLSIFQSSTADQARSPSVTSTWLGSSDGHGNIDSPRSSAESTVLEHTNGVDPEFPPPAERIYDLEPLLQEMEPADAQKMASSMGPFLHSFNPYAVRNYVPDWYADWSRFHPDTLQAMDILLNQIIEPAATDGSAVAMAPPSLGDVQEGTNMGENDFMSQDAFHVEEMQTPDVYSVMLSTPPQAFVNMPLNAMNEFVDRTKELNPETVPCDILRAKLRQTRRYIEKYKELVAAVPPGRQAYENPKLMEAFEAFDRLTVEEKQAVCDVLQNALPSEAIEAGPEAEFLHSLSSSVSNCVSKNK